MIEIVSRVEKTYYFVGIFLIFMPKILNFYLKKELKNMIHTVTF